MICAYDTLMIIQDCRICHCPRPNRPPQCFRKICDQRSTVEKSILVDYIKITTISLTKKLNHYNIKTAKNTGQCPPAYLNLDDQKVCSSPPRQSPCKTDQQCPGQQICCFDYCAGYKCKNPLPLDNAQAPQQPQYGRFMG